jgi:hypothetical protein
MEIEELKTQVQSSINNKVFKLQLNGGIELQVYPDSLNEFNGHLFFMAKEGNEKFLFITSFKRESNIYSKFEGEEKHIEDFGDQTFVKKCFLNTYNRKSLQEIFKFTTPEVIGLQNSFGFGDRIGLANPGHLRSLEGSSFKPILAQQSIRELTRTNRTADEVMDAAVWAIFQEGCKKGFGADADHLKTVDDIDYMVKAGYKMLTFDPSDYVDNKADNYSVKELSKVIYDLEWQDLNDLYDESKKRYLKKIKINDELTVEPREIELQRAYAKYGKTLIHIKNLYEYVTLNYSNGDFDVEVSVDETESVTSIFEHLFIAAELTRLGIRFVSLAPRFVGDFEKGIDYKGDLKIFREEYKKHLAITKYFGNYKISLHSGSDKFSAYKVIGTLKDGYIHVKTAGTSYLEALKVIALKHPGLFRKILDFSTGLYETEKKTYHVSADISKVKGCDSYRDDEMLELFSSNDVRQVLHVTFGRVLTEKDEKGEYIFKDRIMKCLKENEETHYKLLIEHFHKHLSPFK